MKIVLVIALIAAGLIYSFWSFNRFKQSVAGRDYKINDMVDAIDVETKDRDVKRRFRLFQMEGLIVGLIWLGVIWWLLTS